MINSDSHFNIDDFDFIKLRNYCITNRKKLYSVYYYYLSRNPLVINQRTSNYNYGHIADEFGKLYNMHGIYVALAINHLINGGLLDG